MNQAVHCGMMLMVGAVLGSGLLTGCGHQLFDDSTRSRQSIIGKYYDDDSAVQTTESRRKAAEMGFGFPTGPADQ